MEEKKLRIMAFGWESTKGQKRKVRQFERDHFRLHFILNGKGTYENSTGKYAVKGGDGFIIYPGETPRYMIDEEDPWDYFWIAIQGDLLEEYFRSLGFSRERTIYASKESASSTRKKLLDLSADMMAEKQSTALIQKHLDLYLEDISIYDEIDTCLAEYFDQCLQYIREHYWEDISVKDLARTCNIDRTYVYKIFMNRLNEAPKQYISKYRIKKACEMLRFSKKSVSDIAYDVGFQDFSSFSRQFKKYCGISPRKYRKEKDDEGLF